MKFGVSLLGLSLPQAVETARAADELGFESVWLSDHLVVPVAPGEMTQEHGQVPPGLPIYDMGSTISYLGATTRRIRIGTWVYVLPLRHPFVTARAFGTADILTGGRVEFGVGAGYLKGEFEAAGIDFAARGRMTDEALRVCRSLWSEQEPEFHGQYFDFDAVGFEPKPMQRPWPVIQVGGESDAAMRRAARFGDGWIGTEQTPDSLVTQLRRLREAQEKAARTTPLMVTVAAGPVTGRKGAPQVDGAMIDEFAAMGVDRLIVRPWKYRAEAVESLARFASELMEEVRA